MTEPTTTKPDLPFEVEVRGVKARIIPSHMRSRRGCFVVWNSEAWLLGGSGQWRSEDNQEREAVFPSLADAQAFIDKLNAEWEREKQQTLLDRADAEDRCESVLACGGLVESPTTIPHGPFSVMDGAPWNVLDSRGVRIALCGGDSPVDWERYGPPVAEAVVAALNAAAPPASQPPQCEQGTPDAKGTGEVCVGNHDAVALAVVAAYQALSLELEACQKAVKAAERERDTLKDGLRHVRKCECCSEWDWDGCEQGREIEKLIL